MLQKDRGEQIKQTSDVRNKGQNTDTGFVESIHEKKARVEKTSRKLSDEPCHDGGEEHTESASAKVVLYVINVNPLSDASFDATEKTVHNDPFLPIGEIFQETKICYYEHIILDYA
jgi:hypothetical protein